MMRCLLFAYLFIYSLNCWGRLSSPAASLKVLQMNIWQEGTMVKGGFEAIVDEVMHTDADVVFLSEVRNYGGKPLVPRLLDALSKKGKHYYGNAPTTLDVAVLSKYRQHEQTEIYPDHQGSGSILRVLMQAGGHTLAAYSAHLNYTNYACYLPRGYDGFTWKKLHTPVSNADSVLTANRRSWREESIAVFIEAARKDIGNGHRVILAGDFNEPSHLDWQADTKDLCDHNGLVVNWDCSTLLYRAGFKDAYRVLHPNAVTHPGFTFPSDNAHAPVDKLTWAPDADERDRIDFVYYHPAAGFTPCKAFVVGPTSTIVRARRVEENSRDAFIAPRAVWPSDHKAVLVEFSY